MMAVRGPLGLSPSSNSLISAFSPFSDRFDSPRPASSSGSSGSRGARSTMSDPDRTSTTLKAPELPRNSITSPHSSVGPSPIYSEAGTEFADTEEAVEDTSSAKPNEREKSRQRSQEPAKRQPQPQPQAKPQPQPQKEEVASPEKLGSARIPLRVNTNPSTSWAYSRPAPVEVDDEIEPQSVIHAPAGFGQFLPSDIGTPTANPSNTQSRPELESARTESSESLESVRSDTTITMDTEDTARDGPVPPTPLQTQLPLTQDWSSTPRAQTRQDLGAFSRPGSSLASILEGDDTLEFSSADTGDESDVSKRNTLFRTAEDEVEALTSALSECWTLCNTLASLSSIHRERIFNFSGKGDMQQLAWKSCWKLCQNLYDTQEGIISTSARPTLDLCREFCAALFEVRVRDNETADSVLRVSFELNNHLFNTHDRSLPEAFRERTLDFYITLCHRLMKQKARMAEETDSLLRACWSLAEMLFSLRQNKREGRKPDEELLGSAVQACWELCDLFREGWTQIRPERGTPRPSQTTFTQAYNQAKRTGFAPLDENGNPKPLPETPTTIFEDTINMVSPDDPPPQPNIMVLGAVAPSEVRSVASTPALPQQTRIAQGYPHSALPTNRRFWPSVSATTSVHSLSAITESVTAAQIPNPTNRPTGSAASTQTIRNPNPNTSLQPTPEDTPLILLKTLFVKAALSANRGYTSTSSDPNLNNLPQFAKNLPDTAFGSQIWQVTLLENYRQAVMNDAGFRSLGVAGSVGERGRVNAVEVARAVRGMTSCVYGFGWLRDLYRFVFGFYVEEALKGEEGGDQETGRVEKGFRKEAQKRSRSVASADSRA